MVPDDSPDPEFTTRRILPRTTLLRRNTLSRVVEPLRLHNCWLEEAGEVAAEPTGPASGPAKLMNNLPETSARQIRTRMLG